MAGGERPRSLSPRALLRGLLTLVAAAQANAAFIPDAPYAIATFGDM